VNAHQDWSNLHCREATGTACDSCATIQSLINSYAMQNCFHDIVDGSDPIKLSIINALWTIEIVKHTILVLAFRPLTYNHLRRRDLL
jgi:hypothetical protein